MTRFGLLAAALAVGTAAGCFPTHTTTRSQAADEPADKEAVGTVGQKTVVGNTEPVPVTGVGLVYNLRGTGSSPPAGDLRAALENALLKRKGQPKDLLDDPGKTTSLVLVSAVIPPGAKAGDRLDVTITLPPGSKTTSLKGGVLFPCDLSNREYVGTVRQQLSAAGLPSGKVPAAESSVLTGNRMATAEGPLVAGTFDAPKGADPDAGDTPKLRAGVLYDGGRVLADRPYHFLLADNSPQPRLAMVVAERLNTAFHAVGDATGKLADAKVQGRPLVVAGVPPAYRLNHTRFLLVARQVPLVPVDADHPYRRQLEHDLVNPATALTAALKLEALGADSRQALRVGLQSDSPWVRFASAEALAYLGHPDGAKDLGELAAAHPALRAHALLALASLDDAVCTDTLADLMKRPDADLRYGAFVALRRADPTHDAVRGRFVNGSFWLHPVAPEGEPLVHVNPGRRAEVVLYGPGHPLRTPFSFPLGTDLTVTARADDPEVTVTRVGTNEDGDTVAVPRKCRADLGAVLATLAELGGGYAEAVELVRRAEKAEVLAAPVAFDAGPRPVPVQQLAHLSRTDATLEKADAEADRLRRGGSEVVQASHADLPTDADAVQAKPKPPEPPPLNREPGRLFGPKRPTADEPEADKGPALNREPGRLFGK